MGIRTDDLNNNSTVDRDKLDINNNYHIWYDYYTAKNRIVTTNCLHTIQNMGIRTDDLNNNSTVEIN